MTRTFTPCPIAAADELVTLGNRAFDEGRNPHHYYTFAEAILTALDAGDDALAETIRVEAVAWLAR